MCYYFIEVLEYLDTDGRSPFAKWFSTVPPPAAAKVTTALTRLHHGNFSNVKAVTGGIFEYRLDFGPGYRIYFGKDGAKVIILLAGGTKKRQHNDISIAAARWQDYKQRKRRG